MVNFQKSVKYNAKLRLAMDGPSGAGKTYTALNIAKHLGGKVALIDTERGSASKYADLFDFDVLELESFHPHRYIEAIQEAGKAGYSVLIIDSLSHAWMGKDGALELVDRAAKRSNSGNSFMAWREVTPIHNALVDAILQSPVHVIATMRSKSHYIMEEKNGKQVPKKVGTEAVQRDQIEFEFDVFANLDLDNNFIVQKSRCPALTGAFVPRAGQEVAETLTGWLKGEPVPELPKRQVAPSFPDLPEKSRSWEGAPSTLPLAPSLTSDVVEREAADIIKRSKRLYATFRAGGWSEAVGRDYIKARFDQESSKALTEEEVITLVAEIKTGAVRDWVELGSPESLFRDYRRMRFEKESSAALTQEETLALNEEVKKGLVRAWVEVGSPVGEETAVRDEAMAS